jgi:hypothetical protein
VRLRVSNPTPATRVVTINNFPPGELSFHAVEARGRIHIEQALAEHLQNAGCCRVKVSITWLVTRGDDPELLPFSMSLNIMQLLESSRSTATSIHTRELFNRLDAQAKAKMEFAESHDSKIVFRSIRDVQMLFTPDRRSQHHAHLLASAPAQQPIRGSGQGSGRAELPTGLRERRCCLNITNRDEFCFRYAMIAWRNGHAGRLHASRPSQYLTNAPAGGRLPAGFKPKFVDCGLNFDMLQFPVHIEDLEPFEEHNNVGVYVYEWHENHAALVRRPSTVRSRDAEVVLLLHDDHWVLVTKHRAFLAGPGQIKQHVCYRCGTVFWHSDVVLNKHLDAGMCLEDVTHQPLDYRLPEEKHSTLRFQKYEHQLSHPIVAYCDFETRQKLTELDEEQDDDVAKPRGLGNSRIAAQNERVASYGYCLFSSVPDLPTMARIVRGDAVEFLKDLVDVGFVIERSSRTLFPSYGRPSSRRSSTRALLATSAVDAAQLPSSAIMTTSQAHTEARRARAATAEPDVRRISSPSSTTLRHTTATSWCWRSQSFVRTLSEKHLQQT